MKRKDRVHTIAAAFIMLLLPLAMLFMCILAILQWAIEMPIVILTLGWYQMPLTTKAVDRLRRFDGIFS